MMLSGPEVKGPGVAWEGRVRVEGHGDEGAEGGREQGDDGAIRGGLDHAGGQAKGGDERLG